MHLFRQVPGSNVVVTTSGGVFLYREERGNEMGDPIKVRNDGRGYLCCDIRQHGRRVTVKVHRLVYETFIGLVPKGYHIDHLDRDKTNNRLENLRLRPASENSADCRKTSRAGTKHTTAEQKAAVQALFKAGWNTTQVASTGLVSTTTARRLRNR